MIELLRHLRPGVLAAQLIDGLERVAGVIAPSAAVDHFFQIIQLQKLLSGTIRTVIIVGGLFVVMSVFEYFSGPRRTPYRTRVFAQDLIYALFYEGGFFAVLMWAAIANALQARLAFLRIDQLASLPGPVHLILYWISADFVHYWIHRLEHEWSPLWAIHSIHHVQPEMSFVTTYRFHPLEMLLMNSMSVLPLVIIGVPTESWLLLTATLWVTDAVQHSALDWTYGRGYALVVSPRFHALHHSRDPRHYNRNYSKIFSIWDYMFGTAIKDERPERIGVEGMDVPRTLGAQMLAPFRLLTGRTR